MPRGKLQLCRDGTLVGHALQQFSGDEKVQGLFGRDETAFKPEPQAGERREQRGIRAWRQTLTPKQTQRFTARYKLSAPADAQVTGRR